MHTPLTEQIRRRPGLLAAARQTRRTIDRTGFAAAQAVVERHPATEILVVLGMRRSGNHLAITWILEQADGSAVFFNNIDPTRLPQTARMTEYRLRLGNRAPRIVFSYEDASVAQVLGGPLAGVLETADARGRAIRFALILRDPYNLFASRLRKWPERFADQDEVAAQTALYAEHAALAGAPRPIWRDAPLVPVFYNALVQDPAARTGMAEALGIRPGDRGLETVPVYGHGSSFDGMGGRGDEMRNQVFSRWQEMAGDPAFRMILRDPAVRQAGETLFGMQPPPEPA